MREECCRLDGRVARKAEGERNGGVGIGCEEGEMDETMSWEVQRQYEIIHGILYSLRRRDEGD